MVRRALTGTSGCVVLCGNNRIPDSFLTESQWPIFWRNARGETSEAVPAHESQLCVFAMLPCFFCVWVNCGSGGIPAPPRTCIHAWSIFFPHLAAFSVFVCFCHFLPTNSYTCRPVVYNHLVALFNLEVLLIVTLPLWPFIHTQTDYQATKTRASG